MQIKKIQRLIRQKSPFNQEKTESIIKEHFGHIPTLVKIVLKHHKFNAIKVLDVGCAYGNSLLHWRKDSEGVEIQKQMIQFLEATGRKIYPLNADEELIGKAVQKENYDAVYAAAIIEHLVAPHLFLARLHCLLRPNGILAISYPVVPPKILQAVWKKIIGFQGWSDSTHINFFTPKDSKLMIERAGFKVLKQYSPIFYRLSFLRKINSWFLPIDVSCLSICQKINNYRYSKKRKPQFDPYWAKDLSKTFGSEKIKAENSGQLYFS